MCLAIDDGGGGKGKYKKLISKVLFYQRALAQLEKYTLHFLLSWHLWW